MRRGNLHTGARKAERSVGHIGGVWHELGGEAGTRAIGLRRIEISPERFSTPVHEHGEEEEIFYVLGGEGLLWQQGETFALAPGDCIAHRPRRGAHTLRAGASGLDVLAFGQRLDASLTALPRAGVAWSGARWLELGEGEGPFAREAAVGAPHCPEPSAERPANVVPLQAAPSAFGGRMRALGRAAGARATGLNHVILQAGETGAPAHCHSLEEELFVVLEGGGVVELWQRGERERHPLEAGDVIARLPGSGVAHALRAGEEGLAYLAYGTREPGDMCFYPESGRVSLRGLGIALRSPEIDYL
ncbi:MAG TPA: cupin domain-containing protein [Solirubrobacteraceae bacterium]|nr:cupin domain-containing protein [Solirubrobacteraceae bacterium]